MNVIKTKNVAGNPHKYTEIKVILLFTNVRYNYIVYK
jgi:hypothetical protein